MRETRGHVLGKLRDRLQRLAEHGGDHVHGLMGLREPKPILNGVDYKRRVIKYFLIF